MKKDFLAKYLVLDNQVRVITLSCKEVVNEYIKNVSPTPLASVTIGRLMSASLMMGSMLKGNESVMVSFDGNGPIGVIRAEADANGTVRGFVSNPNVNLPLNDRGGFDVSSAVGTNGFLSVRKQLNMKEPFIGTCEIISGEIGEDLCYYYGMSEQTPTMMGLGVLLDEKGMCKEAGGFLIQLLPSADDKCYDEVEKLTKKITSVSKILQESDTHKDIITHLFKESEFLFDYEVCFKCNCSRKKTMMMLSQLELSELDEEINKNEGIDVTCNFCQKAYHITTKELIKVKEDKVNGLYRVK